MGWTTSQSNNLIGRMVSVLHVRHALKNNSVPSSAKQQREISTFMVLTTCNVSIQLQFFNSLYIHSRSSFRNFITVKFNFIEMSRVIFTRKDE